jgi:hypothetical protein
MPFHAYILRNCSTGRFYVGHTHHTMFALSDGKVGAMLCVTKQDLAL